MTKSYENDSQKNLLISFFKKKTTYKDIVSILVLV